MKKIVFVTGTRADFGKLKPLMLAVDQDPAFECLIFATGMHVLSRYGATVEEVQKAGFRNIHTYMNQIYGEPMEMVLANTISGLSRYLHEYQPDLIVVHGDRVEALAGAITGALRNVLVAHIEGGELSGTIDELIRHSVSKMSHLHFVANQEAEERLRQLGESPERIYVIGSPDIDIMLSEQLPTFKEVTARYGIRFRKYGIVMYHPVTTELNQQRERARALVDALINSKMNYIVIYPNNDVGCEEIFAEYQRLEKKSHFQIFPSLRFEYFLSLLKHAGFIIGNSSAGIREAPVYGVPTVNVGTRQQNRFHYESILDVGYNQQAILRAINQVRYLPKSKPCHYFGNGHSGPEFLAALQTPELWQIGTQKQFCDLVATCGKIQPLHFVP